MNVVDNLQGASQHSTDAAGDAESASEFEGTV